MIRQSDIFIRLLEEEQAFIYTVRRGGEAVESAVVPPAGPERDESGLAGDCLNAVEYYEYYGGSQAMD
jgi:hypothetical protein